MSGRLYYLGGARYVQHIGAGQPPPEVLVYTEQHYGEGPPYIPLPAGPTDFELRVNGSREIVSWDGEGPLPEPVLTYVREEHALPPHSGDEMLLPDAGL